MGLVCGGYIFNLMRDNRPFTEQEDKLIKQLFEEQNIKKWSIIARKLTEDHKFPRNAKQCRDRYALNDLGINNT